MSDEAKPIARRREPKQARSRATVDAIVVAAARVFRQEGWEATTNRIAEIAGVGIGSVYEYFPNKESILLAIAQRHMDVAESGVADALDAAPDTATLLAQLQSAIVSAHEFPSEALELVRDVPRVGPRLRTRAVALEHRIIDVLTERATAAGHGDARARAVAAFEAIGPCTARACYLHVDQLPSLAAHYLAMAQGRLA